MANQKKKLQQAAIKFRKENPMLHVTYCTLSYALAKCIVKTGATEATVGYKNGEYYESTNN